MERFEKQEGISFLLIFYVKADLLYYMRFQELKKFWDRAQNGDRKSCRREELDPGFFMKLQRGRLVPYLDCLQKDLDLRE